MTVRRAKRHRKFRGRRTYHGSHKKWRGAGHRGGRGNAGLHKHKWTWTVKFDPDHFGRFVNKRFNPRPKTVNVDYLDKKAEIFLKDKFAEKVGDKIKINVIKLGYDKVLGGGKVTQPLIVEARLFSKLAEQKLVKAGGKAVKVE
jgi:large subunit ribosomal protein L15